MEAIRSIIIAAVIVAMLGLGGLVVVGGGDGRFQDRATPPPRIP